jgi:hypothetical protein
MKTFVWLALTCAESIDLIHIMLLELIVKFKYLLLKLNNRHFVFSDAKVLEENIDWEDVQWSQTGVWIAGKEYPLCRVHFLSKN